MKVPFNEDNPQHYSNIRPQSVHPGMMSPKERRFGLRVDRESDWSDFYKCLIPLVQQAAWECGYNAMVHGSLKRDLDMVAVPWIAQCSSTETLADHVTQWVSGLLLPELRNTAKKPHGRRCYSIHMDYWDHRYIDLSVMVPDFERE